MSNNGKNGDQSTAPPLDTSPGDEGERDDDFVFSYETLGHTIGGVTTQWNQDETTEPWLILFVDDEPSVLAVTHLALKRMVVDDRPVEILEAQSASEAMSILETWPFIATVVTDVVMETDDAGLALIRWIRGQPKFNATRLVLRTGQPGTAPEESVLKAFDINDYWPKTEITAHRMRTLLTGLIRSYSDLRTLQEQNLQLRAMQERLFEQERLKVLGELVSGIAHDFSNALTPITAYTSMLLEVPELTDDERREYLQVVFDASVDADELVERLRAYYRTEGGVNKRHPVSIHKLVNDAASLAKVRLMERTQAVGISIDLKVDVPQDATLHCNGAELRQALVNLLINAFDAMNSDGEVQISAVPVGRDVRIKVRDSGMGMDPATLAQCQDAFFTTKGDGGTGLGLAMVSSTVKGHGGILNVESRLDHGTTISLQLPLDGSGGVSERE